MSHLLLLIKTIPLKPLQLMVAVLGLVLYGPAMTLAQTELLLRDRPKLIAQASNRDLLERLRTADEDERSEIIQVLKRRGNAVIPELIQALETTDPLVRTGAAAALGQLGEASSVALPALLKLLDDDRRALFGSRGDSDYGPIVSASPQPYREAFPLTYSEPNPFYPTPPGGIKEKPYELRKREIPTPPENPRKLVKIAALAAIGQIGPVARSAANQPLAALLGDPDPWVQLNAAWCLGQIGSDVPVLSVYLAALQNPDSSVSNGAAQLMQQNPNLITKAIGTEANATTANQFVQVLGQSSQYPRELAIASLTTIGPAAIPALINGMRDPNPLIRLESATALRRFDRTALLAVPELLRLLKDQGQPPQLPRNPNAVALAMPTVYVSGEEAVAAPDNPDRLVRIAALQTIGTLQPNLATADRQLVSGLLTDRDGWVRLNALWATERLGMNPEPTIYTELVRDERTQMAAIGLLSRNSRLINRLPPELIREIVQSLGREDKYERSQTTSLLVQIKALALPELTQALSHAKPLIRAEAAATIGQIGPAAQSTVPALIPLLQDRGQYAPVPTNPYGLDRETLYAPIASPSYNYGYGRREAQPLVYSIRPPEDGRTLVRSAAIIALGQIRHPDTAAIAALQARAAQDPDQWVKLQAVWALLQLGRDGASLYPSAKSLINSDDAKIQAATNDLLPFLGRKAQGEIIKRYAARLDNPKNRVNTVLEINNQNLGSTTIIPLVPLLRTYLTGDDAVLRGYTVTILANLADQVVQEAASGQMTKKQRQQAIAEYTKVVAAIAQSGARFNTQPVQRLNNSLKRLQSSD
jgi:HEAT repeat protein